MQTCEVERAPEGGGGGKHTPTHQTNRALDVIRFESLNCINESFLVRPYSLV